MQHGDGGRTRLHSGSQEVGRHLAELLVCWRLRRLRARGDQASGKQIRPIARAS